MQQRKMMNYLGDRRVPQREEAKCKMTVMRAKSLSLSVFFKTPKKQQQRNKKRNPSRKRSLSSGPSLIRSQLK